ncbi:MAG: (2Fe-2S)-binding protein [Candidatus Delongbacteria bacterium]|nr:(2Fe-2S)-binding protein [Candidatus Delongbacteria bacterium]MBN2834835.1 (2Fe-2S)-binding protein [Candidatus Delongbacteria bacterium]
MEKKICHCFDVYDKEIIEAIKKNKLKTVEEIGDHLSAGTGCGFCHEDLQDLIDKNVENK